MSSLNIQGGAQQNMQQNGGFDILRLSYPRVEDMNDDFMCKICEKIVNNPTECSNTECGQLFCSSCVDHQQKSSQNASDRYCKVCKSTAIFKQPSQFINRALQQYSICCSHCQKPQPIKDVITHEGACKKLKCSNELCGLSLEGMPDTSSFNINGEEFVSCSKKCKKVTRFSVMLKRNNETEVLRAFELMLRKKIEKKAQLQQYQNQSISNVQNHIFQYQTIAHNRGITQRNDSLDQPLTSNQKRQGFASQRKAKSDVEENKDQSRVNIPMFGFLSEFHEFCWDGDISSKEIVFSHDYRHAFLCESNYYFRTVISNRPFSDGIHYWEIIADARTEHELKVGVTTQQTFNVNSSFSDYDFGFAYYGLGQLRHGSNAVGKPYGKQFKKKGILGVCLNMNTGSLSFALDGEFMGVAFEDQQLKKGPIYAAISLLHIAGFTLVSGLEKPKSEKQQLLHPQSQPISPKNSSKADKTSISNFHHSNYKTQSTINAGAGSGKVSPSNSFTNKFYDRTFAKAYENHHQYEIHQRKLDLVKEEIKKIKQLKKEEDINRIQKIEKVKLIKNQHHTYRQNEKVGEIMKQNMMLVEKLYDIQTHKKFQRTPSNPKARNTKDSKLPVVVLGSLHRPFRVQEAERIDQENLRLMYKIVNIEPNLKKKQMDEQYKDYKKIRNHLSKSPHFDIEKLKENSSRVFNHVESKATINFLPQIGRKRSKSTILYGIQIAESNEQDESKDDKLNKENSRNNDNKSVDTKFKKKQLINNLQPKIRKLNLSANHQLQNEQSLDKIELQKEILDQVLENQRDTQNQKLKNMKASPLHPSSVQTSFELKSPSNLSLQQQIFTARVKNQIFKDKKSLHRSLAETWIHSIGYQGTNKIGSALKDHKGKLKLKKLKKPHNQQDQDSSLIKLNNTDQTQSLPTKTKVILLNQKSLEIFHDDMSDQNPNQVQSQNQQENTGLQRKSLILANGSHKKSKQQISKVNQGNNSLSPLSRDFSMIEDDLDIQKQMSKDQNLQD